ncbi:uncharacterized protein LY89DRAFT_660755 [Mollisia scopiformis]|uniref:Non-structural maintenance of chromosomes element 1 homolog n=1 Tax=Mollisia scopiformis TaxID=149040 RepID=A0A132B4U6_MOLSC|nr:uncharacterized protein LY89DRAFT_660755 [Mollisia scopiformis]KUJ07430.1 hypothetical protein LY89DRAFT_660755 [Mollisia scopiformis]
MSDDGRVAATRYNNGNRAFLQSFLARGTLTFAEAKPMLAAILSVQEASDKEVNEDQIVQADLDSFIEAAAEAVSPFDYEIKSTRNQDTKERIWALVNSVSDPLTQLATTRTTEEIYYIKRFLDAMFETYNTKRREVMAVSDMQALETKIRKGTTRQSNGEAGAQSQAADKGLMSDQTEKLLAQLEKEKWLARTRSGYYMLTPRALMELRTWLVHTYNDADEPEEWQAIKFCEACKEIVTIGQRCSNLDCNTRLHNICEEAYWRARPGKTCAKCDTAWDGKHFVGPKAVTATDDHLREKQRSGVSKRRRADVDEDDNGGEGSSGRRRRTRVEEAPEVEEENEEEGEAEEEEDEEPGHNGSEVVNGGRRRRSNRVVEEEADESGSDE